MTLVVTVLRSGGDFAADHVWAIYEGVHRWAPPGTGFRCLSDVPGVPGRIPLMHDWPGWWSKMEVFRIPGPVLYLDLDTMVVGPLEPLVRMAEEKEFAALKGFSGGPRRLGSGVMAWGGLVSYLYDEFRLDPDRHMAENNTPRWWGDQGFIERHARRVHYIRDDRVVSYKLHCRDGIPPGASLVCFHGNPRPWETDLWRAYNDAA